MPQEEAFAPGVPRLWCEMEKTGETAGEDGKAPEKQRENPAAERWMLWSSRSLPRCGREERTRTDPRPQGRNPSGGGRGGQRGALSSPSTGASASTVVLGLARIRHVVYNGRDRTCLPGQARLKENPTRFASGLPFPVG